MPFAITLATEPTNVYLYKPKSYMFVFQLETLTRETLRMTLLLPLKRSSDHESERYSTSSTSRNSQTSKTNSQRRNLQCEQTRNLTRREVN